MGSYLTSTDLDRADPWCSGDEENHGVWGLVPTELLPRTRASDWDEKVPDVPTGCDLAGLLQVCLYNASVCELIFFSSPENTFKVCEQKY